MKTRVFTLIIAAVIALTMLPVQGMKAFAAEPKKFASVVNETFYKDASAWAKPELEKANELGLIPDILKGVDMTKPITREEFAELAVLLYEKVTGEKSEPASPNPFTDTANPQVLKAYNLGITTGTSKTTFSPNVPINREQCATMLFRTIKAIHPTGNYSVEGVEDFPDQKYISDWAVEAAKYISKMGILTGDAKGNFMPKATTPEQEADGYGMATREQAIALSVRTYYKAPEIKASGTGDTSPGANAGTTIPIPDTNSGGTTSPDPEANVSGKAAKSGPIPAEARAKLPAGFPDIPFASDAKIDPFVGILPAGGDAIVIYYNSKQSQESLYYLYVDFLKDSKDFTTYRVDDLKHYEVGGIKHGYVIGVVVSTDVTESLVTIVAKPYKE